MGATLNLLVYYAIILARSIHKPFPSLRNKLYDLDEVAHAESEAHFIGKTARGAEKKSERKKGPGSNGPALLTVSLP